MSALGPQQTSALALHMSAFDPKRTLVDAAGASPGGNRCITIAHSVCMCRLLPYLPCLFLKSVSLRHSS